MEKDFKEIISTKNIALLLKENKDSLFTLKNFDEIKSIKKNNFVYFYHPMFGNVKQQII
jgi:hypothetical protein